MAKRKTDESFPIVGVGASAGGLEAFSALLAHLATDTGMAFVLVQHLDPQHESALATLLQRKTRLPVQEATNNLRVEPNHVYVIPPNTHLGIVRGVLTLRPRGHGSAAVRTIDFFFEALAADRHTHAIGVVLSGTATDGTLGLEAIKAEGGVTFAQDESARFDSMPRSAITAGCVDFVLAPKQIATELGRIAKHPAIAAGRHQSEAATDPRKSEPTAGAGAKDSFKKILLLLRNHSGVDFSFYKSSTIQRRITRRMVLSRHDTPDAYAQFLRDDAKELDALYSDTLISVTSFFRNQDAFDVLRRKVWPAILQQRSHDPIRVWVLGCSTGQEAYSIAMSFVEASEKTSRTRRLQVFATDLNEALLDRARHGLYGKNTVDDLSADRLQRFFVEEEGGYRISKSLREMVVFARQNVMGDPPFSRMDMVSCRNLLIYFEPDLQKKVFPVFHYALKAGGFLFLGASESVAGFTGLFEPIDKKHKIYRRKAALGVPLQLPMKSAAERVETSGHAADRIRRAAERGLVPSAFQAESNAQREADRVTLNQFAPPGVLVNTELQVLQFRGSTSDYLELPAGKAAFDLLKMARKGLLLPLRTSITQAKKSGKPVRRENVPIERDGKTRAIGIEVIPLTNLQERCFLVLFEDSRNSGRRSTKAAPPPARSARLSRATAAHRIADLESTLEETRDYLQSLQERHEASSEQLQSSNEEVQSANEELQSLNEELETSKEELESSNEELTTYNEEIAHRNAELGRLNDELAKVQRMSAAARDYAEAIIRTLRDPFLILDAGLRVESANDAFYQVFKTTAPQIEKRLIYDIAEGRWNVQHLRRLLEEILPRNSYFNDLEVTLELGALGQRTMLINARRLLDGDGSPSRILLGIQDITEVLQFQSAARRIEARYRALVEATSQVIWTTDAAGAVVEDSSAWRAFTGQTYEQFEGWGWLDAIHRDDRQRVHEFWLRTVESRRPSMTEYRAKHVSGDWRWTEARVVPIFDPDGSVREWIATNSDISERRLRGDGLREADRTKDVFFAMLGHEFRNLLAPIRNAIGIARRTTAGTPFGATPAPFGRTLNSTFEMIEQQLLHMSRLVDDLIDVSRSGRGKITLRLERVNVSRILQDAADEALPLMEGKGLELTVTMPSEPVYLNADSSRIAQLVGSLLHNAWKFTRTGGRIEVSLESDALLPDGAHAVIKVRDSGIGVATDQLPRIFDMFQQVDATLERSIGGVGLGLTLVKTLAELHGGTVDAFSEGIGYGTEFVVRLPALPSVA